MKRPMTYARGHVLAGKRHTVRTSRYVLYAKQKGEAGVCHWCGLKLNWKSLCADHVDGNTENNDPANLVGSCRGCNANRADGTGYGRKKQKSCGQCGTLFIKEMHHKSAVFCSLKCANSRKRGSKATHGTRSRYAYGCRCPQCKGANTRYSRELSIMAKSKTISDT